MPKRKKDRRRTSRESRFIGLRIDEDLLAEVEAVSIEWFPEKHSRYRRNKIIAVLLRMALTAIAVLDDDDIFALVMEYSGERNEE